jgi:hypothetical protein
MGYYAPSAKVFFAFCVLKIAVCSAEGRSPPVAHINWPFHILCRVSLTSFCLLNIHACRLQSSEIKQLAINMVFSHIKYWLGKFQVPTEPGLSTAQLMLTNDDLRPGETNLSGI